MISNEKFLDILQKYFTVKENVDELGDDSIKLIFCTELIDLIIYIDKEDMIVDFCEYANNFDIDDYADIQEEYTSEENISFSLKESISDYNHIKHIFKKVLSCISEETEE